MAGKENAGCGNVRAKVEGDVCWREQLDRNLKRLHSLLFRANLALQEGDFSLSQVLGLSLIGFLYSYSHTDVDEAIVRPIRSQVYSKIRQARRSVVPDSDRLARGEKLVRAFFGVASCGQPAVISVHEIDSLLSREQLIDRPQKLDEAARRNYWLTTGFEDKDARAWITRNLFEKDGLFKLSREDTDTICKLTEWYLGSDMKNWMKDASMGPLRKALRQGIEITKLERRI